MSAESKLTGFLRRGRRTLAEKGVAGASLFAIRLTLSPLLEFGRVVLFERELDGSWAAPPVAPGFHVCLASPGDISRLIASSPNDVHLTERRFQRGDRCVVAVEADGRVVHIRWVTTLPTLIPELDMQIRPRPNEAYFFDGYTRPDARRRGLDGAVRCFIFDLLRTEQITRALSYVRGDNGPGLRAATRWGARIGELWFLRIRGCRAFVLRRDLKWPDVQ